MSHEPSSHKEIIALIKRISGQANFIGTPRIYIDIFDGDLVAAVWFNQVVYWDGKNTEPIGFYKTYAEWKKELGLSRFQVSRVARDCERRGLVNIMFKKVYGTPKNHYLVVWPELLKTLKETLEKPDSKETDSSETDSSEGAETEGSMEGEETPRSLSIEEIPTESPDKESIQGIWLSVVDFLKDNMQRSLFTQYVKDTRAGRFDGNTLFVVASDNDARDWLADRVTSTAEAALLGIVNEPVVVAFVVADELEAA